MSQPMSWRLEDRIVARLDEAISETQRFLKRAREAKKALNRRRTLLCLMGKSAWQLSRYLAGVRKGTIL